MCWKPACSETAGAGAGARAVKRLPVSAIAGKPYGRRMSSHPKHDKAMAKGLRLNKLVKYMAQLPVACALVPCGWFKRLVVRVMERGKTRTPAQRRVAEKERQAEIRRQLR